ncbi:PSD1 and planctomycete cytochrome C domain-containing protein [Verrucomicrobia bacterium]|nr:PSD1 and planctomycete cytochrome C domain-containing protein [Verrucomicrobiota bacterium]MDC0263672.1 PSD1 and planctomycete cytochrome C domain-containing protein [Verrucomicrobiota bacterium]
MKAYIYILSFCLLLLNPLCGEPVHFHAEVRPILMEHCAECHGGVKKASGFSVLSRESMLQDSDSGSPGFITGNAEKSSLIQRLRTRDLDERMPPEGHDPLSAAQVEVLVRWIDEGASWPQHWALTPINKVDVPKGVHPVDHFVSQGLDSEGLAFSPRAEPSILARRLFLDLTGLLPSSDVVNGFVADPSERNYEGLVDQLLASPHFGERWGRHWLDEARYADSLGYEKDSVKKDAWRYRDWVVDALNADMSFENFSRYQLAGDLMQQTEPGALIATKLHLQTQFNLEGGIDAEEDRVKRVVDRVNMFSSTWLGLTMACSQCHDHPYDPVSQREYYSLYAFFNNMDMDASFLGAGPENEETLLKERAGIAEKLEQMLVRQISNKNLNNQTVGLLGGLFNFDNDKGLTRHMRERAEKRRETYVLTRGDFLRPDIQQGLVVPDTPGLFPSMGDRGQLQDRADLVDWLFTDTHPITARVAVNKVWMRLFGTPLVHTVQDFGSRGEQSTHPLLLDWMAGWWQTDAGWSLKRLIKWIVMSDTYQQSSNHRLELKRVDPNNRLLARQNRFRVEAEIIRDISLQTAGLLNLDIGGPAVFPPIPDSVLNQSFTKYGGNSKGRDRYRRGIYTFFRRTAIDPNMMIFDCPDASASKAMRDRSNNALQAMTTLNNEVFLESAQSWSFELLQTLPNATDTIRLNHAFKLALSREPSPDEKAQLIRMLGDARVAFELHEEQALEYLGSYGSKAIIPGEQAAWMTVLRLILNLDEFFTRE